MLNLIYKTAIEQLQNIGSEYRLVVIHPNYAQQHLSFNEILKNNTVYVRFDGHDLTRAQLNAQLQSALQVQVERDTVQPDDLLVLDECDRALSPELDLFLPEVVESVDNGRVFIVTRTPPASTLHNEPLRHKTCFIPRDEGLMLWDYAQRSRDKSVLLEVRALGTGRVMINGKQVDEWDGVLPRSLFFFLVDKGMTTRNDIFETFWPNLTVREATNVFHVTKRKISEVLGVDLTSYWSGFYHISPEIELSYDVVQFSELVQDSVIESLDKSTELLRRAAWLYRDHFLASMSMDWVVKRRLQLRQTYGDALIGLAKVMEKQDLKRDALGLYLRASTTNPQREDIAHSAMHLYRDLEQPTDALYVFKRLDEELRTILGVGPARHLQDLANELEKQLSGKSR